MDLTVTITVSRQGRPAVPSKPDDETFRKSKEIERIFFSRLSFQCEPSSAKTEIKKFICEEMQFKEGPLNLRRACLRYGMIDYIINLNKRDKNLDHYYVNEVPKVLYDQLKSESSAIESEIVKKFGDRYKPEVVVKSNRI